MTRWADIPGFPHYQISDEGTILNKRTGNLQALQTQPGGIRSVALTEEGFKTMVVVRRLVAEAFLPDFDSRFAVSHKDGDYENCHIDNLQMTRTAVRGRARVRTV